MSASGQLSARDSSLKQSAQTPVPASGLRLNLIDWAVIGVVLVGVAGIIYWLRW